MLSSPADFPFFNNYSASPPLYEGWGGHPLCLSEDSSVLMGLHWSCDCTAQSSILSIGSVPLDHSLVKHFPERSWTVVDFPCFTVVKSFIILYTLSLSFFLNFFFQFLYTVLLSSLPSLNVVVHSLRFSVPPGLNRFLSKFSTFVAHIKYICSDPELFCFFLSFFLSSSSFLKIFAKDPPDCFSHC